MKSTGSKKYIYILLLAFSTIGFNSCKKNPDPGPNEVFIENKNFIPSQIAIPAGTTITWTNKDALNHSVTSSSTPKLFDSGKLDRGDTYKYTFTTHGVYDYYCKYYNTTGTIIVQ